MAKRARGLGPKKKDPEYMVSRFREMQMKSSNPDRKDYKRTIAGRGDTHALDGGKIPFSKTARGKAFKEKYKASILSWQDRNVMNRGSKLNP